MKGVVDLSECKFEPKIDKHSIGILQRRKEKYLRSKPEDRLLESGLQTKRKKELMRQSSTKGWFKPHITQKSKEIVAKKTGKLHGDKKVKLKKVGRSKNVTYFHASSGNPKPSQSKSKTWVQRKRNTQNLRKKKKKVENPIKKRQKMALEKSKQRIQTAREERNRLKNPKFKKIADPLPEYKSPYNKEIVQSEIPISRLIDKNTHRRLKKLGRASPKKKYLKGKSKIGQALEMSTTKDKTQSTKTLNSTSNMKRIKSGYKPNPYQTKNQWLAQTGRMKRQQLLGGKKDFLQKNINNIKYLEQKKRQERARKEKAQELNQEVSRNLESSRELKREQSLSRSRSRRSSILSSCSSQNHNRLGNYKKSRKTSKGRKSHKLNQSTHSNHSNRSNRLKNGRFQLIEAPVESRQYKKQKESSHKGINDFEDFRNFRQRRTARKLEKKSKKVKKSVKQLKTGRRTPSGQSYTSKRSRFEDEQYEYGQFGQEAGEYESDIDEDQQSFSNPEMIFD